MRKQVGGGMRQAGVLAAAAIVALEQMMERLAEDHAHAARLAHGLAAIDGIGLNPTTVQTNIVYFDVTKPGWAATRLSAALAAQGVLVNATSPQRLRAVTNYHITAADIQRTVTAVDVVLRHD